MFSFIFKTSYETFRSFVISAQISRKADLKQIYYYFPKHIFSSFFRKHLLASKGHNNLF